MLKAARGRVASLGAMAWSATALLLSLAAVAGVLAGTLAVPPDMVLLAAVVCGLLVAVLGRHRRRVWLPALLLVALALGLWRYGATRPATGPAGLPFYIGRDVTITGTVAAEPEPLDRGENIRLAVQTLTAGGVTRRIGGTVLVHVGGVTALNYGDQLSLAGVLAAPPELPGAAPGSYRAYLASQGIYAVMDYPRLQHLGTGGGNPLLALVIALRLWLEGGIRRILPGPEAALLIGVLLGTRTRALGALTAPFIKTGMIHVVAISGLKVSLIVGTVDRLSRRFLGRWSALVVTLITLALYVLLTGATPSGLRAAVMWTLTLLAIRSGRRSDAVTSLALAAALLALISPRILWDLGFQLSLSGTAGIVLLVPLLERWFNPTVPGMMAVWETFVVTLAAQIGTLPVSIIAFNQISLVSPLANALLLPLLGPIIVLGLFGAVIGALLPSMGWLIGQPISPLLTVMIATVQALARLSFASVPLGPPSLLLVAGYYALVGFTILTWPGSLGDESPEGERPLVAALNLGAWPISMAFCAGALLLTWQVPQSVYTLSVVNVGGSRALLLTTPGGHTVLIDGGDRPSLLDAAVSARLPFWRSHIDAVVSSDVDSAHVAGLRGLTARYTVDRALDPGAVYPSATYALWRAELRDAGVPEGKLRLGTRYRLDAGAYLDVLLPAGLNPDAASAPVALRLVVGRFSLLLINRAALVADPADLVSDGRRHDTALVLPAGADDPSLYAILIHLLRPRLVVLPSLDDARDDPAADGVARRAAREVGARVWQGGDGAGLELTTDGARFTAH